MHPGVPGVPVQIRHRLRHRPGMRLQNGLRHHTAGVQSTHHRHTLRRAKRQIETPHRPLGEPPTAHPARRDTLIQPAHHNIKIGLPGEVTSAQTGQLRSPRIPGDKPHRRPSLMLGVVLTQPPASSLTVHRRRRHSTRSVGVITHRRRLHPPRQRQHPTTTHHTGVGHRVAPHPVLHPLCQCAKRKNGKSGWLLGRSRGGLLAAPEAMKEPRRSTEAENRGRWQKRGTAKRRDAVRLGVGAADGAHPPAPHTSVVHAGCLPCAL